MISPNSLVNSALISCLRAGSAAIKLPEQIVAVIFKVIVLLRDAKPQTGLGARIEFHWSHTHSNAAGEDRTSTTIMRKHASRRESQMKWPIHCSRSLINIAIQLGQITTLFLCARRPQICTLSWLSVHKSASIHPRQGVTGQQQWLSIGTQCHDLGSSVTDSNYTHCTQVIIVCCEINISTTEILTVFLPARVCGAIWVALNT